MKILSGWEGHFSSIKTRRERGLTWKTLSFSLALVALVAVYTLTSSPGVAPCIFIFAVTFPEIKPNFLLYYGKIHFYYFSNNSICPCQRTPQKWEKALPLLPLPAPLSKRKKKKITIPKKTALCDVVWGTASLLGIDSNLFFFSVSKQKGTNKASGFVTKQKPRYFSRRL